MRTPRLLLPLLLLVAPLAGAQTLHVDTVTMRGDHVLVSGTWPGSCTPVLEPLRASASAGTDFLLRDPGDNCKGSGGRDFRTGAVITDPAAFSPAAPAARTALPVRVLARTPGNPDRLVGFTLHGGSGVQPDPGFWWPQGKDARGGTVLGIEVQGTNLGVALLTYDDLSGAPVWYFGTAHLDGGPVHVGLARLDDGASPFLAPAPPPVPGRGLGLDLDFHSATEVRAWLSRPGLSAPGTLELAQLHFTRRSFSDLPAQAHWRGRWLLAREQTPLSSTGGTWPPQLDFDAAPQLDDTHFELDTRDGEHRLSCSRASAEHLAARCTLRRADGSLMARFHQVGLDRLDGSDPDGGRVVLLRAR